MATDLTYSGTLVVLTCWCGIRHAVPDELRRHQLRSHHDGRQVPSIYCPLGHSHVPSGPSKVDQLEATLQANRDQLEAEQRSHAATKSQLTKTKKRLAGGVCPCCNRSFVNLARHMKGQHPDYAEAET